MNKLLIASVVGALSLSGMLATTSALAADATTTTRPNDHGQEGSGKTPRAGTPPDQA